MTSNRKISIVIPYKNRFEMVMEAIQFIESDDRIDEIVICDDCSDRIDFAKLIFETENKKKVKIVRNVENRYILHNKHNAVSFSKNEWCIILDSDNHLTSEYIDKLYDHQWNRFLIYHPAFAAPKFDYRKFNGKIITKNNVKTFVNDVIFITIMNTCNYFVNRDEFLRVYQYDASILAFDALYLSYNWLKANNSIYIVPDLKYFHRVHENCSTLADGYSNKEILDEWTNKFKNL